jgi:hypothetical protein
MTTAELRRDSQGYISQFCEACDRRFKTIPGQGSPNPIAHCPYCENTGKGWWTAEQANYLKGVALNSAEVKPLFDSMKRLARAPNARASPGFGDPPPVPPQPEEPEDELMPKHTFRCCDETIRHEPDVAIIHCVICGRGP